MRRADFLSPAARLEDALKRLEQAWQTTKEEWSDPVSHTVEEEYLKPLHSQVALLLDAVSRTAQVMGKAQRECAHRRELGEDVF